MKKTVFIIDYKKEAVLKMGRGLLLSVARHELPADQKKMAKARVGDAVKAGVILVRKNALTNRWDNTLRFYDDPAKANGFLWYQNGKKNLQYTGRRHLEGAGALRSWLLETPMKVNLQEIMANMAPDSTEFAQYIAAAREANEFQEATKEMGEAVRNRFTLKAEEFYANDEEFGMY